MFRALWTAMRPRSWIRSALVFVPLISSRNFLQPVAIERAIAVFAGFSLLSSAVYLFNDVTDRHADARHPLKRNRPVAAGRVSVRAALTLAAVLLAGALAVALSLGRSALAALFIAYVVSNVPY